MPLTALSLCSQQHKLFKFSVSSIVATDRQDSFLWNFVCDIEPYEFQACVNTKRAKSGRSQNSNSFTSKKDKLKRGSNSRRSSNKENHPDTKKD